MLDWADLTCSMVFSCPVESVKWQGASLLLLIVDVFPCSAVNAPAHSMIAAMCAPARLPDYCMQQDVNA